MDSFVDVPPPRDSEQSVPEPRRVLSSGDAGAHAGRRQQAEDVLDVAAAVEELLGCRDRAAAARSDEELVAGIADCESVIRAALVWQAEQIAESEQRGLHTAAGTRSMPVWLREMLNIHAGDATSRVVVARAVTDRTEPGGLQQAPSLPATAGVLRAREMSLAHAKVIVDGIAALPPWTSAERRAEAEELLADEAKKLSPRELEVLARRIRYLLDQDGALREEQNQIERRELQLTTGRDGMTVLKGRLDRETGAKLRAALEPLTGPRAQNTGERAQNTGERDMRSASKRRADAFAELLETSLGSDALPRSGGQRPHMAVTINVDQLRGTAEDAAARFGGTIDTTGQPITADNARRIACDAEILPVLLDGESRPLDVGRAQRSAPPHLRAALLARDGSCAFPGCDHPPGTAQAHHIRHWADGGHTALTNLVMLCAHHHTVIHAQHWNIQLHQGRPVFTPPAWVDPARTPRPGNRAHHEPPHLTTD
ncbi:MAG: DUF222 domain-containing protein [Saccharopolyspora sp.]|uniref:HNH endonuclease signature motif containing protein n=1 Tax=Saccharopolyspora sp. TaxID=33915 RepID=UPI0025E7A539|nr:HNH endonuclease signature motif containing protein [Saccharopolyspora sp.]MBQ6642006.1 DUF222 domain-containing protein [Saccharopolyspora sp.]